MKKGKLITFEGIDGSGKSTQMMLLGEWLTKQKIPCVLSCEPGGTLFGSRIRHLLLSSSDDPPTPLTESLLFLADRAHHFETKIEPFLKEGKIVLIDRFIDSTIAYQGCGKQVGIHFLEEMNTIVTRGRVPDLTFLLDIDVYAALARKMVHLDRMENRNLLQRVRASYLSLSTRHTHRFIKIDATQEKRAIHEHIVNAVKKLLAEE